MESSVIRRIHALQQMSVGELRDEWFKLYGEASRSRNRDYLSRRLAWRVQELAHGGLSDAAKARIDELAPAGFQRARTPGNPAPEATSVPAREKRDPRASTPGTVIVKQYKGRELRVVVREDGFEFEGVMYGSLTALAKKLTGCASINGRLFWGLSQRKR